MAGKERNIKVVIEDVKKTYMGRNGEVVALNGVNLEIAHNEFVTVVGPSGCGKSTLLNIIAGLLEPTSGRVICNGNEVHGTGMDRGVVFQQYALFPWLTVLKNVMFPLNMKGIKGKEAEETAMKYIRMVSVQGLNGSRIVSSCPPVMLRCRYRQYSLWKRHIISSLLELFLMT